MAPPTRRTEVQTSKRAAVESGVMQATLALLSEGASFAELSVEQIATRAGISRPAFYFYFRDKRELLERVTSGVAEQLYAVAEHWWSGTGHGADELAAALAPLVGFYRRHATLLRATVETAAYDGEIARYWRAVVARFVDATRARIEREQADGYVDPALPAAAVAFALCWMTERTAYEHLVQEGEADDDALLDALRAIWLGAVYGRPR